MAEIELTQPILGKINLMINRSKSNHDQVGLVMRWNEDDRYLWTVWDEAYGGNLGEAPPDRRPVTQLKPDSRKRKNDVGMTGVKGTLVGNEKQKGRGGHAEENLFRTWHGCRADAGAIDPNILEILITHVPCLNQSSPYTDEYGIWPSGCGPKLSKFIKNLYTVRECRIAYINHYGGASSKKDSEASVRLLNRVDNVECHALGEQVGFHPW